MYVGRVTETKELLRLTTLESSDLLMVTGRRRVGKTYIINEVLKDYIVFKFTGTQYGSTENQLEKFTQKISEFENKSTQYKVPESWSEAFGLLKQYILHLRKSKKKKVIFIDEFPWIDQPKSGFLQEFAYWWNDFAATQNLLVVISGSATSWMVKKIIQNRGGLHNRVTKRMHLEPFSLAETKAFLHTINKNLTDYDILYIYMCVGGIPLYLQQLISGESAAQFVHRVCFTKSGLLRTEFEELYASLFDNFQNHIAVIRALATKWSGMTIGEISKQSKISDGGGLHRILDDLELGSFLVKLPPLFNKKKGAIYRLADEYSRFYIHFIEGQKHGTINNWLSYQSSSDVYQSWQGYAFESICIKHVDAIKACLGIAGINATIGSYLHKGDVESDGIQIDMLIDRADNVINIFEIKYYNKPIRVSAAFADKLRARNATFCAITKTKKAVFNTLITTFGTDKTEYTSSEIHSEADMSCLFRLERL
jgi:uncharacterized protein